MKKNRGFAISMLIIYIVIGTIFLGSFATVVTSFSRQIYKMNGYCEQHSQYSVFNTRFIKDMKRNTSITAVTAAGVTFGDGTIYTYSNGNLYRYGIALINNITSLQFTSNTVNSKQVVTLTYTSFYKGGTVSYTTNYVLGRGY